MAPGSVNEGRAPGSWRSRSGPYSGNPRNELSCKYRTLHLTVKLHIVYLTLFEEERDIFLTKLYQNITKKDFSVSYYVF